MDTMTRVDNVTSEGWSAVSWASIAAGAVSAAALSLALLAFGAGLGLSSISPWADSGVLAATFRTGSGIYLVIVAVMFCDRRILGGAPTYKMDRPAHKRGIFSRHGPWFYRLGIRDCAERHCARRCGNARRGRGGFRNRASNGYGSAEFQPVSGLC